MPKRSLLTALALAAISAPPPSVLAAEKTVTLSVPGLSCATCPISVRMALGKVPGVRNVKVTFEPKEAVVTFDDAKARVEQLTEATKQAGFPSSLKSGK